MTKIGALRELGVEELHAKEHELGEEIRHLRMRRATAQLASPAKLRTARKDLARVKTLIRERQGAKR